MDEVEYVLPTPEALSERELRAFVKELQVMMFQRHDGKFDADMEWGSGQLGCIGWLMNKHKLSPVPKK